MTNPDTHSSEYVSLREYIDMLFKERDRALQLQYTEYMRRLHDLNNSHEIQRRAQLEALQVAKDDTAKFATKEGFTQFAQRYEERHEQLLRRILVLEGTVLSLFLTIIGLVALLKI